MLYYTHGKIYLKKSAKGLHISIYPLIFAREWLKPPVC